MAALVRIIVLFHNLLPKRNVPKLKLLRTNRRCGVPQRNSFQEMLPLQGSVFYHVKSALRSKRHKFVVCGSYGSA